MASYPVPPDEAKRLAALEDIQILDTEPEPEFDRMTQLAVQLLGTPVAMICLVDRHRVWSKSRVGINEVETSRAAAFCAHTIADQDILLVPDAQDDERFARHPMVVGGPRIRGYMGAPLTASGRHNVGTLCVVDHQPISPTDQQIDQLKTLAAMTSDIFDLRTSLMRIWRGAAFPMGQMRLAARHGS